MGTTKGLPVSSTTLYGLWAAMAFSSAATGFFHHRQSHRTSHDLPLMVAPPLSASSNATSLLLDELSESLDQFILTGSPTIKEKAASTYQQIENQACDEDIALAKRRLQRAGFSLEGLGATDAEKRKREFEARKEWEVQQAGSNASGRSALSQRKPDVMLGQLDPRLSSLQRVAGSRQLLKDELENKSTDGIAHDDSGEDSDILDVEAHVSAIIAKTGASNFNGTALGIGGLDDVLSEIRRRIWIPLAAPPKVLRELGITPVRGLLMYGDPGCGKSLLAGKISSILSPMRSVSCVLLTRGSTTHFFLVLHVVLQPLLAAQKSWTSSSAAAKRTYGSCSITHHNFMNSSAKGKKQHLSQKR